MSIAPQWYALAVVMTFGNGVTLGLVARRERHRTLWLWTAGWLAWAGSILPLALLGKAAPTAPAVASAGPLWVVSTLCFLAGTYALTGRQLPRVWWAVGAACAVSGLVVGVGLGNTAGMVPLVIFQCAGLASTGVLIVRTARRRVGAWLAGGALVLLALHVLDAPLASREPSLLMWGFVLAAALEVLAALGMITLYYEHAREQLLGAQRALAETSRIEALGRVAGGVAHDFNNMLTVMQAHLDLLGNRRDWDEDTRASLREMGGAVGQAGRLTHQLLSFGRRSTLSRRRIDVADVVRNTVELLRRVMPAGVRLELEIAEGSYAANMARALLEQIVLNLVTNARDAVEGSGTVSVELSRGRQRAPALVLRVRDDGRGMDADVLEHVFEPFFTTKPAGSGTGLGLASVHGAVTQLDGSIEVSSRPREGTTFEVVLPLTEDATERVAAPGFTHEAP